MKIAIVGTGIAGMTAAHLLHQQHELAVFEKSDWIGGHTHTVDVESQGQRFAIDTGFIVFNRKTYPNFCKLLRRLGVESQPSDMSFSVRCDADGLEYNGTSINGLFAQRFNALRPRFWGMLADIRRFYKEAPSLLADANDQVTVGEYLERGGYGRAFVEQHLVPMGAAIWSAQPDALRRFPLLFLLRFFHNHGFLQVDGRPQWLVIRGGSREYVEALVAPFRRALRLNTPVTKVETVDDGVLVHASGAPAEHFDRVILATHADTSLELLHQPTASERSVLGAFQYQRNEVALHQDSAVLPKQRRAWASWNYRVTDPPNALPTLTYWMNCLQRLQTTQQYFVTLNGTAALEPTKVLRTFVYHHPVYSTQAVAAQKRHKEIDGVRGVHFCGAYWGWGFHEDGVKSAMAVAGRIPAMART